MPSQPSALQDPSGGEAGQGCLGANCQWTAFISSVSQVNGMSSIEQHLFKTRIRFKFDKAFQQLRVCRVCNKTHAFERAWRSQFFQFLVNHGKPIQLAGQSSSCKMYFLLVKRHIQPTMLDDLVP